MSAMYGDRQFENRDEAGRILGERLRAYADRDDVIILALPRGGVPVGYRVARVLGAPLDVFLVRKLGVPGHEELAMRARARGAGPARGGVWRGPASTGCPGQDRSPGG